jgi:DNA-binding NarL/FixJ family response regulator
MSVRVVLAEDDLFVREGIQRLLDVEPLVDVVAAYETPDALLQAIDRDQPDVIVTDIRMPPEERDEGIRLARGLRDSHPGVGVVVLSNYLEPGYALRVFDGGAEGRAYLLKQRVGSREELVRAIVDVADGGSVVDPRVVEALVESRRRTSAPVTKLTARELEVLGLVAEGASNERIASVLVLSKGAVEKHINGIFSKLGLADERDVSRRVKATLFYLGHAESA